MEQLVALITRAIIIAKSFCVELGTTLLEDLTIKLSRWSSTRKIVRLTWQERRPSDDVADEISKLKTKIDAAV